MDEVVSILDVVGSLEEVIASEFDGLRPVPNMQHFQAFTEGYQPKGQVLYNMTNLVLTDPSDFDYYRYYAGTDALVAQMTFPPYNLNLWAISHINSAVITNALKPD